MTCAPEWGNRPFPRGIYWQGKSWNDVIESHVDGHATGGDIWIAFDEDDRLHVAMVGKADATSFIIPKALCAYAEELVAEKGVEPRPLRNIFRKTRGDAGRILLQEETPPRADLTGILSRETGAPAEVFAAALPEDMEIVNARLDAGPFLIEEIPSGAIFGCISRQGREGAQTHATWWVLNRSEDGDHVLRQRGVYTDSRRAGHILDAMRIRVADLAQEYRAAHEPQTPEM